MLDKAFPDVVVESESFKAEHVSICDMLYDSLQLVCPCGMLDVSLPDVMELYSIE